MLEPGYFERKRAELGMSRGDSLVTIQAYFEKLYPGQVHAKQIQKGVLKVTTESAPVASTLRMRQLEILKGIQDLKLEDEVTRIVITIG